MKEKEKKIEAFLGLSEHGKLVLELLNHPERMTGYIKSGEGAGADALAEDVYEQLLKPAGW